MKKVLRESIQNNYFCNCNKNTIDALRKRNLCDENGELSLEGKVIAIAISSLKTQAMALNIPIKTTKINYKNNPELFARNHLLENGEYRNACVAEGGDIRVLLFCMCFDEIWRTWKEHPYFKKYGGTDPICFMSNCSLACSDLLDVRPDLYKELIQNIYNANQDIIENSFCLIRKSQGDLGGNSNYWPWHDYVGLRLPLLLSLYKALGNENLAGIARKYFTDPAAFNKGWPDITAIDSKNDVTLFEVKTTDKFHPSQIVTIKEMSPFFKTEIIQLQRV